MNKWMKKAALIGLGMSMLLAVGCTKDAGSEVGKAVANGDKVKIYTTLQAQADFAKAIGGDKVEVSTYMPLNTNFWQWAPTVKEVSDMESAHVFIKNGSNVEDRWWDQTYATVKLKNKDLLVIDASEGLEKDPLERYFNPDANEEDKKKPRTNPWLYLDPVSAKQEVDTILAGLVKKAPSYADEFKKNAEDYKKRLDELDQKYKSTLASVKHKEIISPYPAWHYIAKRYGLKFYVPDTIAINDYPWDDVEKQKAVLEDLKKHDATTIFFEGEAAPRVQEFLFQGGFAAAQLNPFEGKMETNPKSYVQVMEQNLKALEAGLNK